MTVRLPAYVVSLIYEGAAASYPLESCGLLAGYWSPDGQTLAITEAHPSPNVTDGDPKRGFEVDPKLRFDVMRALQNRADGTEIVGHWHSHPDHPAEPSERDLAAAYEPDFVWLICRSTQDGASDLGAFRVNDKKDGFERLQLAIG